MKERRNTHQYQYISNHLKKNIKYNMKIIFLLSPYALTLAIIATMVWLLLARAGWPGDVTFVDGRTMKFTMPCITLAQKQYLLLSYIFEVLNFYIFPSNDNTAHFFLIFLEQWRSQNWDLRQITKEDNRTGAVTGIPHIWNQFDYANKIYV